MLDRPIAQVVLSAALLLGGCAGAARDAASRQAQAQAHSVVVTATTAPGDIDEIEIPGTGVSFALAFIPGGTFTMGSPEDEEGRSTDEGPRRSVSVSPFWMGVHEVRWDEYAILRFIDRDADTTAVPGGAYRTDAVVRPSPPYEDPSHGMGSEGHPVVSMTQWGALQYARWLSEKTGEFYRLPTEAEWEYACRAGTDDPPATGVVLDRTAWYWDNSGETFHRVGEKRSNAWGLHDMLGNVAEWTLDQYAQDYFEQLPGDGVEDPWITPTALHPRTVRGGAYDDDPEALRCAARLESSLNWKRRDPQIPKSFWWNTDSPFLGFRLVRPATAPSAEEQADFWAAVLGE